MAFPAAFIDELIARNPIEDVVGQYVTLKRSGANMFGLCPFHGEKTASFSVSPDKGIYYCFGCHKGGGAINFMMEVEGLTYPDAVRSLAKRAGMEVPEDEQYQSRYRKQERLWALNKEAARFFHSQLYAPEGAKGLAYVQKRGLSKGILTQFGIGYAPDSWNALISAMRKKGYTDQELIDADLVGEKNGRIYDRFRNRVMFPIIDVRGNVIGFGGRVLDDGTPKYLNTSETIIFNKRKNLFGLNLAKKSKQGYLILVEGNIDVVTLHQYGFDCAVASLGTSLTEEHAALLSRYTEEVLKMRDAKDPDEFLHKFGPDAFRLLLEESSNRVDYQLAAIAGKYDLKDDDQKVRYVQEASELICTLDSSVKREIYGTRVAEKAGITSEAMKLEVNKAFKRRINREKKQQEKIDLAPAQALQPKLRSVRYQNMRSAMAEEAILGKALRQPSLLSMADKIRGLDFSVPLLGNVFDQLKARYAQGLEVSLGVIADLTAEEMSHIAGIMQRHSEPGGEDAFRDCIRIILQEKQAASVESDADLLALRDKMKESKGTKG